MKMKLMAWTKAKLAGNRADTAFEMRVVFVFQSFAEIYGRLPQKRRGASLPAALHDGKRVRGPIRRSLSVLECGGWRGTGLTPLSRCDALPHFRALPKFMGAFPKRRWRLRFPPHSTTASEFVGLSADRFASWSAGGRRGTGLTPLSRCDALPHFRALPKFMGAFPKSGVALRFPPHSTTASEFVGLSAHSLASWSAVAGGEQS